MNNTAISHINCRKLVNGRLTDAEVAVIREASLDIYLDGRHLATTALTPVLQREFVTGYLFGQGFIDSVAEITSLEIDGNRARVGTTQHQAARAEYRVVSGGGREAFREGMGYPVLNKGMMVSPPGIFKAMNAVFSRADLYAATEGAHAAGIFTPTGACICLAEDIGRHNCLDKAIGHALLNGTDLSGTLLATTGRLSTEMVGKVCRAGIPVAATKTAVTAAALEMARRRGLTVIGFVRDSGTRINTDMSVRVIMEAGMKIYTHAGRVTGGKA